jgi:ArsR family transcriptional regulator
MIFLGIFMVDDLEFCKTNILHRGVIEKVKKRMAGIENMAELSELFKVLGDITRVRILNALFFSEMCVCDIAALLDMTQSAISHQLRVLKYSRLVKYRKEGKVVYYSLDDIHIKEIFKSGFEHIREK